MGRFVIFGTPGSYDVMVNTDHVVAIDQGADAELGDSNTTCRLWLTSKLWTDDEGENGQNYVDVVGCLLDVQAVLNG